MPNPYLRRALEEQQESRKATKAPAKKTSAAKKTAAKKAASPADSNPPSETQE